MTTRKRNDWLEPAESEEEDTDHSLDIGEGSRHVAFAGRSAKRRKSNRSYSDDSDGTSDSDDGTNRNDANELPDGHPEGPDVSSTSTKQVTPKPRADSAKVKDFIASQKAAARSGVIYLSRVPPFMKPQTVRQLLSPFGTIGRIFLTPEDPSAYSRRVKSGGNKKRSFTDGWVEFASKKDAKIVAETLNAQIIGGKKGSWYHDDVWNIKYLKGFKWHNLTEQIAAENAARADRLRREIAQTTKENNLFLQNVERAKMLDGMEAKRQRKVGGGAAGSAVDPTGTAVEDEKQQREVRRQFKQVKVRSKIKAIDPDDQPDEVKRVLTKIFS